MSKFKDHIKEHKTAYISGSVCFVTGIVIGVVLKTQGTQIINTVAPIFNNDNSSNAIFGGHTYKIVKNNKTGEIFEKVKDAAESAGVSSAVMSKHLNGHSNAVFGETYSIIGVGTK